MSSWRFDDEGLGDGEAGGGIAKEIDHRLPGLVGAIDDELLDDLDYEEEFASFEPIRRRGGGRR